MPNLLVEFNSFCRQAKLDENYKQHQDQQYKEQCTFFCTFLVFGINNNRILHKETFKGK